jgi:hypothetical protein
MRLPKQRLGIFIAVLWHGLELIHGIGKVDELDIFTA